MLAAVYSLNSPDGLIEQLFGTNNKEIIYPAIHLHTKRIHKILVWMQDFLVVSFL